MVEKRQNKCEVCSVDYFGFGSKFCSYKCSAKNKKINGWIVKKCKTCKKDFPIKKSDANRRKAEFCSHRCVNHGKETENYRKTFENKKWVKDIKNRDNWGCKKCGSKEKLEAHHIIPFSFLVKECKLLKNFIPLYDLDNGVLLCRNCHKKTDSFNNRYPIEEKLFNCLFRYWEKNTNKQIQFDTFYRQWAEKKVAEIKETLN